MISLYSLLTWACVVKIYKVDGDRRGSLNRWSALAGALTPFSQRYVTEQTNQLFDSARQGSSKAE